MKTGPITHSQRGPAALALICCVGFVACTSPNAASPQNTEASPDAGVAAATSSPLRPFAIVPASATTTAATHITKWTLHRLSSGGVLASGWNEHKVVSFVRVSSGPDHNIHLDYGKHGGVIVYDRSGKLVGGYAGAELKKRAKAMSYFADDLSNNGKQPYDCTFDIISASGTLLAASAACAPLLATGPLSPAALTGCVGAQVLNFGAGYYFGIDCGEFGAWYATLGNGTAEEISECDGDSCVSGDPIYFDDGSEGSGDDGSGGTGGRNIEGDPNGTGVDTGIDPSEGINTDESGPEGYPDDGYDDGYDEGSEYGDDYGFDDDFDYDFDSD
jgi:hypothetical protein